MWTPSQPLEGILTPGAPSIMLLLVDMSPLLFQVPLPVSLEQAGQSGEWGSGGKADRADNRLEGNICGFQAKELRAANVTRSSETAKLVQCTELQYRMQVVRRLRTEQFFSVRYRPPHIPV